MQNEYIELMADNFRPTRGLVCVSLEFMKTFVKAEILLESLYNVIYIVAIFEITFSILFFFIFLRKTKSLYFVAIFVFC